MTLAHVASLFLQNPKERLCWTRHPGCLTQATCFFFAWSWRQQACVGYEIYNELAWIVARMSPLHKEGKKNQLYFLGKRLPFCSTDASMRWGKMCLCETCPSGFSVRTKENGQKRNSSLQTKGRTMSFAHRKDHLRRNKVHQIRLHSPQELDVPVHPLPAVVRLVGVSLDFTWRAKIKSGDTFHARLTFFLSVLEDNASQIVFHSNIIRCRYQPAIGVFFCCKIFSVLSQFLHVCFFPACLVKQRVLLRSACVQPFIGTEQRTKDKYFTQVG